MRRFLFTRHPELVSESTAGPEAGLAVDQWMLKQVQHDEAREYSQ